MMRLFARGKWIASAHDRPAAGHALWLICAAVVGFVISFAGVGLARLPRDWFVLAHTIASGGFVLAYARWARFEWREARLNWPLGLLLGIGAAAFSVSFVLSQPSSPGVRGIDLVWTVVWLGLVYGVVDALLLTVLPVYAVWCLARRRGWLRRWPGWMGTGLAAFAASMVVTAAYHFGFPEFRGAALIQPIIGNAIFTLVYLASASPLAPVLSHIALHVAAATHAYHSSIPLPPHY